MTAAQVARIYGVAVELIEQILIHVDDKGRRHRDEPAKPERDTVLGKALHDDLPCDRADRRARQARSHQ